MKIATFNVNSIRVRLPALSLWLKEAEPDVVCLQEIKCEEKNFPTSALEDLGYNVLVHGQKTYNGVAILSRFPVEDSSFGLPGDPADQQARYLETVICADKGIVRVGGLYLPNGNPVDSEKFAYKLSWMERLIAHTRQLLALEEPFVLAGDYNVIPAPEDVYDPSKWEDDALFRLETRSQFRKLLNLGLTDAFRACHSESHRYTFWDYQKGAWQKDHGIRIDHLLLSPQAADKLTACDIDQGLRGREKPSDHVPVWIDLDL